MPLSVVVHTVRLSAVVPACICALLPVTRTGILDLPLYIPDYFTFNLDSLCYVVAGVGNTGETICGYHAISSGTTVYAASLYFGASFYLHTRWIVV